MFLSSREFIMFGSCYGGYKKKIYKNVKVIGKRCWLYNFLV